jgi:hypothetical protein
MANEKYFRNVELINPKTGEVIECTIVGEPYWRVDRGFVKIFAVGLKALVENEQLLGKAGRLLLWIISEKLNWNSYEFYLTEKEATKALKISRRTYYAWIKALIEAGILSKVATNVYRLKPYFAVKGKAKEAEIKLELSPAGRS